MESTTISKQDVNCKTITLEEVKTDNPRLCLSAERYFGKCYKCRIFETCESRIESKEGKQYVEDIDNARKLETIAETLRKKWRKNNEF